MTIMTKLTREFSFSTGGTSGLLMPYPFMLILKTKGSAFYRPPMGINKLQSSTRAVSTRWCFRSVGFLNPTASNMSIYNAKQEIWLGWMCCVTLPHCKCSYSERSD